MVVIHLKRENIKYDLLLQFPVSTQMRNLICTLARTYNARLKTLRLVNAVDELASFGPIRPSESRNLAADLCEKAGLSVAPFGEPTIIDESNMRTGVPPNSDVATLMKRVASDIRARVQKSPCEATEESLVGEIAKLRAVVLIAYPEFNGLPSYDPVRIELTNEVPHDGVSELHDVIDESHSVLWLGSRSFSVDKVGSQTIGDVFGNNEKSKLLVKLCNSKAGPPIRESRVDQESQARLLECYHKRQNELENLRAAEVDDPTADSYLSSEWANPKQLKNSVVNGGKSIRFKFA